MKEATELSRHPTPDVHAAPTDDTNLYEWHFTISGPPRPSPYSTGMYHGRISFPATYPLRPPAFRFLTPSGRFEVNREICLSISGHHEESWQPAWGVRTALVAMRSFMDGDARGQVGGLDVDDAVRRELAAVSRGWVCPVCNRRNMDILEQQQQGGCPEEGNQGETRPAVIQEEQSESETQPESLPGEQSDIQGDIQQTERRRQPDIQPEEQPETENQPERLPGEQPDLQGERQQSERQPHPEIQPERQPAVIQEGHRQRHPERQPEEQPETENQPERLPGEQPDIQGETQQSGRQPDIQPERQPAVIQRHRQPHPEPATHTQPTQVQQRQRQPEDWLDKAILVVLTALVIMIVRRILNAQLDDYL